MNKLNNPMFYNKSKNELKQRRCRDSFHHLMCCCLIYILKDFWAANLLCCFFTSFPLVNSCCRCVCWFLHLLSAWNLKFAQHSNSVIVYKSRKWGMKKGHWAFLDSSSKARLCVYRLRKGWAQGCGACSLLQRCLVCHLTVDCRTAIPPLSKQSCYIFHSKNPRGHQCVWLCSLKPDGGFPINKCTGSIYTDCGTWRHNTHDTLFSGQSCHKSL